MHAHVHLLNGGIRMKNYSMVWKDHVKGKQANGQRKREKKIWWLNHQALGE